MITARLWQGFRTMLEIKKGGCRMTLITTEIQKWKRNKMIMVVFLLTVLLGLFAVDRACSISRNGNETFHKVVAI